MTENVESRPLVIIGGGAAGLMAAIWAGRRGSRPLLLEGANACGLKILVSGGGRCNVLPVAFDDRDFFTSGSRNVLRRLFRTWPLAECRTFFEDDLALPLTEEPDTGKLFPADQKARSVRDRMTVAVESAGGEIRTQWRVTALERSEDRFRIVGRTIDASGEEREETILAERVILASGGKSLPRTGSDGTGYTFARALGHSILPPYPALVPLSSDDEAFCALSGIALPVEWRVRDDRGRVLEERTRALLFTHHGFSGPAILDASHWSVRDGRTVEIAWEGIGEGEWRGRLQEGGSRTVSKVLSETLPRRLAEAICAHAEVAPHRPAGQLRKEERERLIENLTRCALPVNGDLGYRVAEVTGGGIPIGEVDPSTLESRSCPGLYLCGEILDVIGRIGGFNFLWAWVTGRLAGESAAACE